MIAPGHIELDIAELRTEYSASIKQYRKSADHAPGVVVASARYIAALEAEMEWNGTPVVKS